jgi:hypothetical protein
VAIFTWGFLIQVNAKRKFQEYTRKTLLGHEEIRSDFVAKRSENHWLFKGEKFYKPEKHYQSERNRKINEKNA